MSEQEFRKRYTLGKTSDDKSNVIISLVEENEKLKKIIEDVENEKEHYVGLYNECKRKKFSDDEIKRLYRDLQRREYDKHCSGHHTYVYTIKDEANYWLR